MKLKWEVITPFKRIPGCNLLHITIFTFKKKETSNREKNDNRGRR